MRNTIQSFVAGTILASTLLTGSAQSDVCTNAITNNQKVNPDGQTRSIKDLQYPETEITETDYYIEINGTICQIIENMNQDGSVEIIFENAERQNEQELNAIQAEYNNEGKLIKITGISVDRPDFQLYEKFEMLLVDSGATGPLLMRSGDGKTPSGKEYRVTGYFDTNHYGITLGEIRNALGEVWKLTINVSTGDVGFIRSYIVAPDGFTLNNVSTANRRFNPQGAKSNYHADTCYVNEGFISIDAEGDGVDFVANVRNRPRVLDVARNTYIWPYPEDHTGREIYFLEHSDIGPFIYNHNGEPTGNNIYKLWRDGGFICVNEDIPGAKKGLYKVTDRYTMGDGHPDKTVREIGVNLATSIMETEDVFDKYIIHFEYIGPIEG